MADGLSWVFEIIDKASAPAGKMARAVTALGKSMSGGAMAGAKGLGSALDALRHNLFELSVIGMEAFQGLKWLGGKALDFGEHVAKSYEFKENTLLALETMLGSAKAGREVFDMARNMARSTGQDMDQYATYALTLARSTRLKNPATIKMLLAESGDIAAGTGVKENQGAFIDSMTKIAGQGGISARGFLEMQQFGLDPLAIIKRLGGLNLHSTTMSGLMQELQKNEGRYVDAQAAIHAIMETAAARYGPVGTVLQKQGGGFTADLQRFKNSTEDMFMSLANSKAMKSFRDVLKNILSLMNGNGEFRKLLTGFANGPVADFFKQFSGPAGLKKMQDMFAALRVDIVFIANEILNLIAAALKGLHLVEEAVGADPDKRGKLEQVGVAVGGSAYAATQWWGRVTGQIPDAAPNIAPEMVLPAIEITVHVHPDTDAKTSKHTVRNVRVTNPATQGQANGRFAVELGSKSGELLVSSLIPLPQNPSAVAPTIGFAADAASGVISGARAIAKGLFGYLAVGDMPFWEDSPADPSTGLNVWDDIRIGGVNNLGIVTLQVRRQARTDKQQPTTQENAQLTHLGYDNAEVMITIRMFTRTHWQNWIALAPRLQSLPPDPLETASGSSGPPQLPGWDALNVTHPALLAHGIKALYIEAVEPPRPTGIPGIFEAVIRGTEWRPTKQAIVAANTDGAINISDVPATSTAASPKPPPSAVTPAP